MNDATKPDAATVEVSLFGPGYGECVVIHVCGKWIVIDSCIPRGSTEPVAATYLKSIGVNIESDVKTILATHWHDDHVRGLAELAKMCPNADLCISGALHSLEFLNFVNAYIQQPSIATGRGVEEIYEMTRIARQSDRPLVLANPNRSLLYIPPSDSGTGREIRFWSLSPSDHQSNQFLVDIQVSLGELENQTKFRAVSRKPNHAAVVAWLDTGDSRILFGSDLEKTADRRIGWHAVVSGRQVEGKANIFKIPHHGSRTGHLADVWEQMVESSPTLIVTPFRKGKSPLPRDADLERLQTYSDSVYLTANAAASGKVKRRSNSVEKQIKFGTKNGLRPATSGYGGIRVRYPIVGDCVTTVDCFGEAHQVR